MLIAAIIAFCVLVFLVAILPPRISRYLERSGDMRYNGGSVAHLHIHFVTLDPSPAKTVRFRVSAWGED